MISRMESMDSLTAGVMKPQVLSYVLSLGNGHAETSEKFFGVHPVFGTAEAFAPHGEGSRRLAAGGRGSTEMLRIFFHNFQRMR